jgi:predicted phosphodiesterase
MQIAILSDIHSNYAALEAVLENCRNCDRVWCLGDVVGYGPDPVACIERIRAVAEICVAGNHDLAAIGRIPIAEFNGLAAEAAIWTSGQLAAVDRKYLDERPMVEVRDDYTLTHGSPRDPIWEYLMTAKQARENFEYFAGSACFVGHSHVPIAFSTAIRAPGAGARVRVERTDDEREMSFGDRRHIVNVGSVGQPRDGDRRSAYVIVDTESCTYRRRRVPYNIGQTQARMRSAGLPTPLWSRLAYGR